MQNTPKKPSKKFGILVILYFGFLFLVPVAYSADILCEVLLTAHSEEGISVPDYWREIELGLRKKIRTGWIQRGIPGEIAETVLQHLQKMRQAAIVYSRTHPEIDEPKAALMGLVHDLQEAIVPDFTPHAGISKMEKSRIENAAWDTIVANVPGAAPLRLIWLEYEAGETPEARLLKQLDKLDVVVQAHAYEKLGYGGIFDSFPVVRGYFSDPAFVRIYDILMERLFPEVNYFDQYLFLLGHDADRTAYIAEMEKRKQTIELKKLEAKGL